MTSITDEAAAIVQDAVTTVRPLTSSQAKNLERLVINDFNKVRGEIRLHAQQKTREAQLEYERAFESPDKQKFRGKATKLIEKYNRESAAIQEEARVAGITLSIPNIQGGVGNITLGDEAAKKTLNSRIAEINAEMQYALEVVEREFLTAERQVLLATITGPTEDILRTIPTAQALMATAAAERREKRELEAGK